LGLFAANCAGGQAVTTVPESWPATWEDNRKVAQIADQEGIDFLLPIARWKGYDGAGIFHTSSLETTTWATSLLAVTKNLTVFSTVHVAFTHPVMAAKQFATAAQVGNGRFGLNVVCGWNEPEYRMFGLSLPQAHAARYAYGREWLQIVRRLWREQEPFDWRGEHFQLEKAISAPKPPGEEPLILNAAASAEGKDFAIEQSDFLFTSLIDLDRAKNNVATLKALAMERHNRSIEVLGVGHVVCRPTRKEAEDYYDYYANQRADWTGVDRLMQIQSRFAKSFTPDEMQRLRIRFAGGHGTYPLVGSPDDVAAELLRIRQTGLAGIAFSFVNYLNELPYFCAEVLPRFRRMASH